MDVTLEFLGGLATTNNLTGSCTAISVGCGKKTTTILVDVGLVQGDVKNFFTNNSKLLKSINPAKVDYVIITHAHIDHVGLLPFLVNNGFKGKVLCTKQTADLIPIMLADSYKIQRELAKRKCQHADEKPRNKDRTSKETGPLFTERDVAKAINLIMKSGLTYKEQVKLSNQVTLKFYASGHILGGAISVLTMTEPKSKKILRLGFSGDLGRQEGMLLYPPAIVKEPLDCWFTESTYGNKHHPERQPEVDELFATITGAAANGKKIIIPSFALQRSQELIYLLTLAMKSGKIPDIPIYLDSPMSVKLTEVYAKYWDLGSFKNKHTLDFNPFNEENPYVKFITDYDESIKLASTSGPLIVISGSGMCDAGRVRNHLRVNLPSDRTIVCLVGYMSPASLGRKLQGNPAKVNMNGQEVIIKAQIKLFQSFSAHADCIELVDYAKAVLSVDATGQTIFILHGEETGSANLKQLLEAEFSPDGTQVIVPKEKEKVKMKVR